MEVTFVVDRKFVCLFAGDVDISYMYRTIDTDVKRDRERECNVCENEVK